MKKIFYFILNAYLLKFPSRSVRKLVLKKVLKKIGTDTNFLRGVEIREAANIYIGNNSVVNSKVLLDGRGGILKIGNNVDIAQETNIWTLGHDPHSDFHDSKGGPVTIDDYVWIASRVTILPNIRIGRGAVIASNSVVTKNIEPMSIVAGNPAKPIGKRKSKLLYNLNYRPWLK
ncbi:acyltransferase [Polaribacter sp. WD7]|uniref:acyltransferase n=1 Tax=Polaribacter sp. WD7 TaxID=2269061 RepID=UPI002162AA8F|nr:acyltransferase [Polaribacter sp. WD7]